MTTKIRNFFGTGSHRTVEAAARVGVFLAALGGWLGCPAVLAQEAARDFIEPRVSRPQFTVLVQQLGLDAGQRSIAELTFSDYSTGLDALARQLDEQSKLAGRETVQSALTGKARVAPEELKRLRVAVLSVYQQGWPVIDEALDDLLNGIESLLTPEQLPHFLPAVRALRRDILLHPRQADADYQEYAGDGVDVLLLAQAALAEGGELQPLGAGAAQDVLAAYEQGLDALLTRSAAEYRNSKLLRKIAGIDKNSAAMHDLEQAALGRWKELFLLNQAAVQQIGEIAAANIGEDARRRWLDRFDQASFTWLFPRRRPDRQIEWIRQQPLPDEKLQQAQAIYENYISHRKDLSHQAIEMMVRGRLEFQTMLYSMMDPTGMDDRVCRGLYDELLKNTGELTNLESTTSGALEGLLSDSQRDAMRKAMVGPDPALRRR